MKTILMNTEESKAREPHNFRLNLTKKLELRSLDKHAALQNLSPYYRSKKIRQQYKNKKLKIGAPMRDDQFNICF